jgi:A/G-specific adenine glycosylase
MNRFPDFHSLANSSEAEVIKYWEGLGYYSRAKNLRKAAIYILEKWDGIMPDRPHYLAEIPGIGPYTVGAIRAFAFKKKAAAVDGNVMRVLSRYFALQDDISKTKAQQQIREIADQILPDDQPWEIAEGLIELGAIICKKNPLCPQCPLKSSCEANLKGLTEQLPVKTKAITGIKLYRTVAVLQYRDQFLIRQVQEGKVMAGLHEFPYFEEQLDSEALQEKISVEFNLSATPVRKFPIVQHGFTRYRAYLDPYLLQSKNDHTPEGYFWVLKDKLSELAFSSGHKRILELC